MTDEAAPVRTCLYRHFASDGTLLYVGVSLSAVQRLAQHQDSSRWFEKIGRVDVEWFDTREAALEAETAAIRAEAPIFNIKKKREPENPPSALRADESRDAIVRRIVEFAPTYSPERAADLLSITVSRLNLLAKQGKIGSVIISSRDWKMPTGNRKSVRRIFTGWQIVEFLETCERNGVFPDAQPIKET